MKILHIPCAYHPVKGGAEILIQRISETLASQGHEVIVLTSNVSSVADYFYLGGRSVKTGEANINNVKVIKLPFYGLGHRLANLICTKVRFKRIRSKVCQAVLDYYKKAFTKKIQNYIKTIAPEVVMATPHLLPNVAAAIEARKRIPFPLVIVPCLHEEDPNWSIKNMASALRNADIILTMTNYEKSRLIKDYAIDKNNIRNGGMGVDIPRHAQLEISEREKKILFLGRKVPQKNITLLIEAMQLVWRKDPAVKLVLAGARSVETTEIDKRIASLPVEFQKKITSLDDINENEKRYLLASSFCLVLPSKIESFGGVILEAWAYSTPIIALDIPAIRSFVENGKDGILISDCTTDNLAQAILDLMQNPDFARSLGRAGKIKAETQFSWENTALRHLEAYRYAILKSKEEKAACI